MIKSRFHELLLATGFLTRLPLPSFLFQFHDEIPSLRASSWAFPLIGAVVGALSGLVLISCLALGLGSEIAVMLALLMSVLITGALHEDGLADFSDGLGVADRARALEVMRDSRSGSFGVLALIFSVGLKAIGLSALFSAHNFAPFTAVLIMAALHGSARAAMAGMMILPLASADGLAAAARTGAGIGERFAPLAAVLIGLGLGFLLVGFVLGGLFLMVSLCGAGLAAWIAFHRLGGMTGDVYGAGEQLAEIFIILSLVSFYSA